MAIRVEHAGARRWAAREGPADSQHADKIRRDWHASFLVVITSGPNPVFVHYLPWCGTVSQTPVSTMNFWSDPHSNQHRVENLLPFHML